MSHFESVLLTSRSEREAKCFRLITDRCLQSAEDTTGNVNGLPFPESSIQCRSRSTVLIATVIILIIKLKLMIAEISYDGNHADNRLYDTAKRHN